MRPLDPRLLREARTTRRYLGTLAVLGLAGVVMVIAQAQLLATAITRVFLGGGGLGAISWLLAGLAAVVAGRALLAWANEVAAHRASAGVKSELRARLLTRVTELGPGWLHGERTGEVVTLATRGLDALDAYFARYLPQLVLSALVPAAILAVVAPVDLVAGLTIALTLPLIPIFMVLIGLSTQRHNRRQLAALSRLTHHLMEIVAGLPTLRVFNRAKSQAAKIRSLTEEQRRHGMRTLRLAFLSSLALELLATLSVALVAVGIGLRVVNGSLDLRTALLVLILAPEAYLPLRMVGTHYHASAEGLAASERVFAILATPAPDSGGRSEVADLRRTPIVLEDVTVTFGDRGVPALARLNLRVRPGEVLAIAGPSGCGKSTVANLLLRFVSPDAGRILVGSTELDQLEVAAWRAQIGYVAQHSYLFAGTVGENVALGSPDVPGDQVAAAVAAAGLADLPLDTVVTGLSAGQRQRVALARAFLRDAPLVVLDEPTANLDPQTEAAILPAIRRLAQGRTVVLIAHRPALRALGDRVVELTAPAITETGVTETGVTEAGVTETGVTEAGVTETGVTEAGVTETGVTEPSRVVAR